MIRAQRPFADGLADGGACAAHRGAFAAYVALLLLLPLAALLPPPGDLILVLPINGAAEDEGWLQAHGAQTIGPGRREGSVVVRGSWRRLVLPALGHGAILLSVSQSACLAPQESRR